MKNSKLTMHMVSSLDGFIAKKDNSVSWLEYADKYEKGVTLTEDDVDRFIKSIDCYVMGSRTYELALEIGWPYGDVPVIVLTKRNLKSDRAKTEFYKGDLNNLVHNQLKQNYRNIWIVGGSMVAKDFLKLQLVDDLIISIKPIILGGGTLFFDYIGQESMLHLKDVTAYNDGMVELWYEIIKNA